MKITLESIQQELDPLGWQVVSTEYKNLDTEMEFLCKEGHSVHSTWKKLRKNIECPLCKQNIYNKEGVIPSKKCGTRVLALDQATHDTGWALYENTQLISHGVFHAPSGDDLKRYKAIRDWFVSMLKNTKPDYVGIEGIQFQDMSSGRRMGVDVFEKLARLQGVLMITAEDFGVQFKICPTNTWRSHCGVKGRTRNDKKSSMQRLIKEWYDVTVSDDVADAIGIGKYVSETLTPMIQVENWE